MYIFGKNIQKATGFFVGLALLAAPLSVQAFVFYPPLPFFTNSNYSTFNSAAAAYNIYHSLSLAKYGLSGQAFYQALTGFEKLRRLGKIKNDEVLTIIDFSQSSIKKRLFVIDIKNRKLLFNTYVSHGMNSGLAMAEQFSNKPESHQSSLGFYVTADTYQGKHGYSLHLLGCEKGINDNAYYRDIVIHGASYVSESVIRTNGYLGRSQGCPALPQGLTKPVIDKIKNGSCLFIYAPSRSYIKMSGLV